MHAARIYNTRTLTLVGSLPRSSLPTFVFIPGWGRISLHSAGLGMVVVVVFVNSICGGGALGEPERKGEGQCDNMRLLRKQRKRVLMGQSDVAGWGIFLQISKVAGDDRLGIYAKKRIEAGEEIFYDYCYPNEVAPVWALKPLAGPPLPPPSPRPPMDR
ncbi:histone-lysine N-methyltransferase EZA1 [Tanacetum coccineum]